MKALVCLECGDVRALDPTGPVSCRCGQAVGEWVDPVRGTARVWGRREATRIMGIHNGLFRLAATINPWGHRRWKDAHRELTAAAEGYVFHSDVRDCWVAIIVPGETNDTSWGQPGERPE